MLQSCEKVENPIFTESNNLLKCEGGVHKDSLFIYKSSIYNLEQNVRKSHKSKFHGMLLGFLGFCNHFSEGNM